MGRVGRERATGREVFVSAGWWCHVPECGGTRVLSYESGARTRRQSGGTANFPGAQRSGWLLRRVEVRGSVCVAGRLWAVWRRDRATGPQGWPSGIGRSLRRNNIAPPNHKFKSNQRHFEPHPSQQLNLSSAEPLGTTFAFYCRAGRPTSFTCTPCSTEAHHDEPSGGADMAPLSAIVQNWTSSQHCAPLKRLSPLTAIDIFILTAPQ